MCTICMHVAQRGQEKASGPLKLELEMDLSNHVGAGNQAALGPQQKQQVSLIAELFLPP